MFMNTLRASKVQEAASTGRARWHLSAPLVYRSALLRQTLMVPEGFETDFASVPRLPGLYWLFGDTAHASAVVHDYLCRHRYPMGLITWSTAADVFNEAMRAEGVAGWRRVLMTAAVKWLGQPVARLLG